jgi:hypothetical protein
MPQAKRSTSTRARTSKFKQPPALKRLTTSLDNAQKALTELTKGGGHDVGTGAKDLYSDLRKFVSSANRSSSKLGKALQRDFDQAQKQLAKATKSGSTTRGSSSRSTAKRSTSSRSTASRATSARSTSGRSTGGSTTRRTSSASGAAKRSTGGTTKRRTTKS